MSRRSTSLALLGLALAGCTPDPTLPPPRTDHDREWIADYAIELEVDEDDPSRGHFEVRFDYEAWPEPKQIGFKFFGRDPLDRVEVTDIHGDPLQLWRPSGFEEQRVEWAVPPPEGDRRTQTVIVAFDQDLDRSYAWGRQYVEIPWAHQFAIPVEHMRVSSRVSGRFDDEDGFACVPEGERLRCARASDGVFTVDRLPAGSYDDSFPLALLAGAFALFFAFAGVRLRRLWATYLDWYAESELPKPRKLKDRKAPRIPPPLPSRATPKLSQARRREFIAGQVSVLLAPPLGCGALALLGRSELPLGWSVLLVGAVMIGLSAIHLGRVRDPSGALIIVLGALWTAVLLRFGAYAAYLGAPSVLVYGVVILTLNDARSKPMPPRAAPPVSSSPKPRSTGSTPSRSYRPLPQQQPAAQSTSSFDWDFTSSCGGGGGCGGCGG